MYDIGDLVYIKSRDIINTDNELVIILGEVVTVTDSYILIHSVNKDTDCISARFYPSEFKTDVLYANSNINTLKNVEIKPILDKQIKTYKDILREMSKSINLHHDKYYTIQLSGSRSSGFKYKILR